MEERQVKVIQLGRSLVVVVPKRLFQKGEIVKQKIGSKTIIILKIEKGGLGGAGEDGGLSHGRD
jgi:hypothetical protein